MLCVQSPVVGMAEPSDIERPIVILVMCNRFPPIAWQAEKRAYLAFGAPQVAVCQRLADEGVGFDLPGVLSIVPPATRPYPLQVPATIALCRQALHPAVLFAISHLPQPPGKTVTGIQFAATCTEPGAVLRAVFPCCLAVADLAPLVQAIRPGPIAAKRINRFDAPAAVAAFLSGGGW